MLQKGSAKILVIKKKSKTERRKTKKLIKINKNNNIQRKLIMIYFFFFVKLLGMLPRIFQTNISLLGALIGDLEQKNMILRIN